MYSNESKTQRGYRCESYVIDELIRRGFTLIVRNYRVHNVGELDIVMERNQDVYVIEVKARYVFKNYPNPIEAITLSKRIKLQKTTSQMIREFALYGRNIHFLASLVYLNGDGSVQKVEIVPF